MTVRELIGGDVIWIAPDATIRSAAVAMKNNGVGSLAVEVDGALEGIFTERDLLDAVAEGADLDRARVANWMTAYPDSIDPDMPVPEAADWMLASGYRHIPVVDGPVVLGMISIKDVLWAMSEPTRT
ncbi:MAG TPA: CBS domain-containing protein [Acidimicrobiia bacterium]|nr:CBS domain-containing protein [Acidimicrobiia bacterium]